ncbi:hypothetical protein FQA39_LY00828 [Lamprigera yunnana]|nr:hypothetical protein FQA39_LY00828 [Lamprigera yunnana]
MTQVQSISVLILITQVPFLTFKNENKIPIIGLGTSQASSVEVIQAVKDAIDIGYRHIDCAFIYKNEKDVGTALAAKISDGTVKREDLFITSKLWNTYHRPGIVETALRRSLKDLRLEYVDLYLVHWPLGYKEEEQSNNQEIQPQFSDYDYVDTWKAMEEIQKKGLAKSIGLSNFNKHQIERVLEKAEILPVVNQIERHPYFNQEKLIDFCKSKNIEIIAYSPFGSPGRFQNRMKLLEDDRLKKIANKYNKTPAQIALRWQIQKNVVVIPKSINKSRLRENFDIFNFTLSLEDMSVIDSFHNGERLILLSMANTHKLYPFNDEF